MTEQVQYNEFWQIYDYDEMMEEKIYEIRAKRAIPSEQELPTLMGPPMEDCVDLECIKPAIAKSRLLTEAQAIEVVRMRKAKKSYRTIAKAMNVGQDTIRRFWERYQVCRQSRLTAPVQRRIALERLIPWRNKHDGNGLNEINWWQNQSITLLFQSLRLHGDKLVNDFLTQKFQYEYPSLYQALHSRTHRKI